MRKILFITALFYLLVASCHRSKSVAKEEMIKTIDSAQMSDITTREWLYGESYCEVSIF